VADGDQVVAVGMQYWDEFFDEVDGAGVGVVQQDYQPGVIWVISM
jgi:hypothetical protein